MPWEFAVEEKLLAVEDPAVAQPESVNGTNGTITCINLGMATLRGHGTPKASYATKLRKKWGLGSTGSTWRTGTVRKACLRHGLRSIYRWKVGVAGEPPHIELCLGNQASIRALQLEVVSQLINTNGQGPLSADVASAANCILIEFLLCTPDELRSKADAENNAQHDRRRVSECDINEQVERLIDQCQSLRITEGGTWDATSPTCIWKLASAAEVEPTPEWWAAWEAAGKAAGLPVASYQQRIALVAPMTQADFRKSRLASCNPLLSSIEMAPTKAGEGKGRALGGPLLGGAGVDGRCEGPLLRARKTGTPLLGVGLLVC